MTPAPDHAGACEFAKVIVTWRGYSDKEVNLAAAYRDIDARLNAACDTFAELLDICATAELDRRAKFLVDEVQRICADAIDAAHAGGGA